MIKVFTHNDLDGAGCAVLARAFYGPKYPKMSISYVNYDNIDKEITNFVQNNYSVQNNDLILISDISPNRDTADLLNKIYNGKNLQLFDHHVTKSWIGDYRWAAFDKEFCGTSLMYLFILSTGIKQDFEKYEGFVNAVEAWDIWKLKSKYRKRGENLNSLFKFLGTDRFVKHFTDHPDADLDDLKYSYVLHVLKDNKDKYVEKTIKDQLHSSEYHMDGFGNTFKIIFCTDYFSEIGNAALLDKDAQDLKYIILVNPVINTCSLRSIGDFDVSAIAKLLGGGGHRNAAGFMMRFREKLEKTIHNKLLSIN